MDAGVALIPDENYATASSEWLQVSRQQSAKRIFNIGLFVVGFGTFLNSSLIEITCFILSSVYINGGHAVTQWLRYCATNQKFTG
jgi:hypothetical protein